MLHEKAFECHTFSFPCFQINTIYNTKEKHFAVELLIERNTVHNIICNDVIIQWYYYKNKSNRKHLNREFEF